MKFKRNQKDQRLFQIVTIICAFISFSGIVWTIIHFDQQIIRITILSTITCIISFLISKKTAKDFIEFNDTCIYIISSSIKLDIKLRDIKKILIPSEIAFKSKLLANNIVFYCEKGKFTTSYSEDIEKYINVHFRDLIEYYDKYSKVIG